MASSHFFCLKNPTQPFLSFYVLIIGLFCIFSKGLNGGFGGSFSYDNNTSTLLELFCASLWAIS
jgi:hypothetical protein